MTGRPHASPPDSPSSRALAQTTTVAPATSDAPAPTEAPAADADDDGGNYDGILFVVQALVVVGAIVMGTRSSGVGLGIWGGVGTAVLVFFFSVEPGSPPVDAILIILAVILAAATMQVAGGIDWMVAMAAKAIMSRPKQVTLLNIRDQQVNFRVIEGRVHHQNLEFQVNDITLRSQGSVGFDQTVQLTLHVPIQDSWIAKEPLLAGFKGQSLQIPVSGTLTHPQLDERAIASLSQQLLQGAAQQAIGGELNKALDKIFKPR